MRATFHTDMHILENQIFLLPTVLFAILQPSIVRGKVQNGHQ